MWIARAALVSIAFLLTACASGPRTVDAEVRTHAAQPLGAAVLNGARYRFEPAPGPAPAAAGQPAPDRLQPLAEAALARVGLVRDDAAPRLSVQLGGLANVYWRDAWDPYGGWSNARLALGRGHGWRGGFGFGYGGPMWDAGLPRYVTEVSLLMRDLQTGQIVYDTRARHDGAAPASEPVLAALLAAALQGWPQPPEGVRHVGVPVVPAATALPASAPAPAPAPAPAR
jgi:hypothetical protein